jgi:hypothetical protein
VCYSANLEQPVQGKCRAGSFFGSTLRETIETRINFRGYLHSVALSDLTGTEDKRNPRKDLGCQVGPLPTLTVPVLDRVSKPVVQSPLSPIDDHRVEK